MALLTIPGVAAQTTTDYDQDDDGLIEVNSLARLNAIRWDLDGDGVADQVYWDHDGNPSTLVQIDASATAANAVSYAAAFPNAATGMGCPSAGCTGYELEVDLDFDTDGDGDVDADDASGAYWNGGDGWDPIGYFTVGTTSTAFAATFEGNNHTIANLYINRTGVSYVGLFGWCYGAGAKIRKVGLLDVDVTGDERVGGLVGSNQGDGASDNPAISNSSVAGTVSGRRGSAGWSGITTAAA